MTSEADRRAYAKWRSKPENKKKHNEWCYRKRKEERRRRFERHVDYIMTIKEERTSVLEYMLDNFNLKKRD